MDIEPLIPLTNVGRLEPSSDKTESVLLKYIRGAGTGRKGKHTLRSRKNSITTTTDGQFAKLPFVNKQNQFEFIPGNYTIPTPKYIEISYEKLVDGCETNLNSSKFHAVDKNDPKLDLRLQSIYSFFSSQWNISHGSLPQVMLSIQGSSKWNKLDDQQMYKIKIFEDSIYEIAANIDAWLISDGESNGIGRIVGTSREKHMHGHRNKVPVIGISSNGPRKSPNGSSEIRRSGKQIQRETNAEDYDLSHEYLVILNNKEGKNSKKAKWFRKHLEYYANGTYALDPEDDKIPVCGLTYLHSYYGREVNIHIPLIYIYIGGVWSDIYALNEHLSNHVGVILIRNDASAETRHQKKIQDTESLVEMLTYGLKMYRAKLEKTNALIAAKEVIASLITRPLMHQAIATEAAKPTTKTAPARDPFLIKNIFKNQLRKLLLQSESIQVVDPYKDELTDAITSVVEDGLEYRSLMPEYAIGYLQAAIALWQYNGCNLRQKLTLKTVRLVSDNIDQILWHALINYKDSTSVRCIKLMTEEVFASYGYIKLLEFAKPRTLMKMFYHDYRDIYCYPDEEFQTFMRQPVHGDVKTFIQLLKKLKYDLVFYPNIIRKCRYDVLDIKDDGSGSYSWNTLEGAHQGLLLWAVVTEKSDLTDYLWKKSRLTIPTALAIASICHTVKKTKCIDSDTQLDFERYGKTYKQRAIDIFTEAWDTEWVNAERLLGYPHREWGDFTTLDLAEIARSHGFLALPGVWSTLNHIWSEKRTLLKLDTSARAVFYVNWASHVVFNMLFMYLLMARICLQVAWVEYALLFWMVMFALEEGRQIYTYEGTAIIHRLRSWWESPWNKSDLLIVVIYFTGFVLHHVYHAVHESDSDMCPLQLDWYLYGIQILYAVCFVISMTRMMHFLIVFDNIGPKILALGHMFYDVASFFALLVIFMLIYGTISQSLLYPNEWRFLHIMRGLGLKSYFHIFGELFMAETSVYIGEDHDSPEGEGHCDNSTYKHDYNATFKRCSSAGYTTELVLAIYMLIANVVLLNMLIAMMSFSFESIQENRGGYKNEWYMWKYMLIKEFYKRPIWVPPINFMYFIRYALTSDILEEKNWANITGHKGLITIDEAIIIDKAAMHKCCVVVDASSNIEQTNYKEKIIELEKIITVLKNKANSTAGMRSSKPPSQPTPGNEFQDALQKRKKQLIEINQTSDYEIHERDFSSASQLERSDTVFTDISIQSSSNFNQEIVSDGIQQDIQHGISLESLASTVPAPPPLQNMKSYRGKGNSRKPSGKI